jgi:peptidoglycan/xylan/chitin deacetylase (PgdA/CDA1 family)
MTRFPGAVLFAPGFGILDEMESLRAFILRCATLAERPVARMTLAASVVTLVFGLSASAFASDLRVPILAYHRFGTVAADHMTVTTPVFESHLRYVHESGCTVIPLRRLVDHLLGVAPASPPQSVVITADDGHRSVYTEMLPLVRRYEIPVTLFIYPSAISRADYALTWEQLKTLQATGLFDVQSHTYWHPHFGREKRRLAPPTYARFVRFQLDRSRQMLHERLGSRIDMLAWPFGFYDDGLIGQAVAAGYVAGVTLDRRHARTGDRVMALPRYLMTDHDRGAAFERLLSVPPIRR